MIVGLILQLGGFACKDNPSGSNIPNAGLTVVDVEVTEAWIRVSSIISNGSKDLALTQDGRRFVTTRFFGPDTTIYADSLMPGRTYVFGARIKADYAFLSDSISLAVRTLDTTGHEFDVTIDTLGDAASALYDVAVINDSLAYAVGEIYYRDSTGQFNTDPFNFLTWNGKSWTLQQSATYVQLRAVFAFSSTDVWVGSSAPYHWDGTRWHGYNVAGVFGGYIKKFWGTSSSNLYMVGTNGSIAHFDGVIWHNLSSRITGTIQDISGIRNPADGSLDILSVAAEVTSMGDQMILRIVGNHVVGTVEGVPDRRFYSIWFANPSRIFSCGDGVFTRGPDNVWKEIAGINVLPVFTEKLRGTASNDLFVVGDFGAVAHYNGLNFQRYPHAAAAAVYASVDFKGNTMFAVGYTSSRAILLRMSRRSPAR